jgi:cyclophilin family peptidyl-prolyl cis-trans isomerase
LLHSPTIVSVIADNRGEVIIQFDRDTVGEMNAATITKSTVQMRGAGPDGIPGNGDDPRIPASVRYDDANARLTVRGNVPARQGYRVKLLGNQIRTKFDEPIDGEFNGTFPSGNGVAGGNFEFKVKNDSTDFPRARFSTSAGAITVRLFRRTTNGTVANFMGLADEAYWDGSLIHRNGRQAGGGDFVVQGGGFSQTFSGGVPVQLPNRPTINFERGLSNTRGRLAMARSGGFTTGLNTASTQWFFNTVNNTFLDPPAAPNNGGYCAFGEIVSGLNVMDTISGYSNVNLEPGNPNTPFSEFPRPTPTTVVQIRRIAVLMRVQAV